MRKLFSIVLIALLLFNVMGYYGIFISLKYKNDISQIQRLDRDTYSESETFTIKVPMAIPYQEGEGNYKRVNGEVEFQGNFYRLVKQKLSGDTMYIVCLKDIQSKKIKQALTDYVKTFTDKASSTKQSSKVLTSFIKDYLPTSISIGSSAPGWNYTLTFKTTEDLFQNLPRSISSPPPQA